MFDTIDLIKLKMKMEMNLNVGEMVLSFECDGNGFEFGKWK